MLLGYFAGVDPEIVDQVKYESWAGVVKLDMAVEAVNDPELTDLYWEHMGEGGFSPGSEELVLRLIELTIEHGGPHEAGPHNPSDPSQEWAPEKGPSRALGNRDAVTASAPHMPGTTCGSTPAAVGHRA